MNIDSELQEELMDLEDLDEDDPDRPPRASAGCKLGGHPDWVQGSEWGVWFDPLRSSHPGSLTPSSPECESKMTLFLMQIEGCEQLSYDWGDSGAAQIFACPNHPYRVGLSWACH